MLASTSGANPCSRWSRTCRALAWGKEIQIMTALQITCAGGPEVLKLVGVEVPNPSVGELLVKVGAAGVNFADTVRRRGAFIPPQHAFRLLISWLMKLDSIDKATSPTN